MEESCDKEAIANMYCAPGEIYIEFCFFFRFFFLFIISASELNSEPHFGCDGLSAGSFGGVNSMQACRAISRPHSHAHKTLIHGQT